MAGKIREHTSPAHRAALSRAQTGTKNHQWKGDDAGYDAKHSFVARNKQKTGTCSECGTTPAPPEGRTYGTEWHNVDHKYSRDLDDYVELCPPCHDDADDKLGALKGRYNRGRVIE